jgi:hypothetical protein
VLHRICDSIRVSRGGAGCLEARPSVVSVRRGPVVVRALREGRLACGADSQLSNPILSYAPCVLISTMQATKKVAHGKQLTMEEAVYRCGPYFRPLG